jgi:hypothetical protein
MGLNFEAEEDDEGFHGIQSKKNDYLLRARYHMNFPSYAHLRLCAINVSTKHVRYPISNYHHISPTTLHKHIQNNNLYQTF